VGAGISGITAALEAAETGKDVVLLEKRSFDTKFKIPDYSQLMSVAYGRSAKDAGLDGNIIRAKQLEEVASK